MYRLVVSPFLFAADGTRMEETSERRSVQETCISETEQQMGSRLRPTLAVIPFPAILVGYLSY